MHEGVKLVRKVDGLSEFRVMPALVEELGPRGLGAEILERGFAASDIGTPYMRLGVWVIPIRRGQVD